MAERYTKPLTAHVLMVHEHTEFLVMRFKRYLLKTIDLIKKHDDYNHPDFSDQFNSMKSIQEELMCVESYVRENWPELEDAFKLIKMVDRDDDEEETPE